MFCEGVAELALQERATTISFHAQRFISVSLHVPSSLMIVRV